MKIGYSFTAILLLIVSSFAYSQSDCVATNDGMLTVHNSQGVEVSRHTKTYKAETAAINLSLIEGRATIKSPDITCTKISSSSSSVVSSVRSSSSVSSTYSSASSVASGSTEIYIPGFGSKSTSAYFDDFSSYSIGSIGSQFGSQVGVLKTLDNANNAQTISSDSYIGVNSFRNDYRKSYFPKTYIDLSGASKRFFFFAHIKISGDPTGAGIWKFGRIGSGEVYHGYPRAGESYGHDPMPSVLSGEAWSDPSTYIAGPSDSAQNGTAPGAEKVYVRDKWLAYSFEFYAGTVGKSDGYVRVVVDGVPVVLWTSIPYLKSDSNLPTWFLTPINGIDGQHSTVINMDGVYADESLARVVFTNNQDYAKSTKFIIQPILRVDNDRLKLKTILEKFSQGEAIYVHAWNEQNQYFNFGVLN